MYAIMFGLGMLVMMIIWKVCKTMDDNLFVELSNPAYRTPLKIKHRFYYIVPETEYIALEIASLLGSPNLSKEGK